MEEHSWKLLSGSHLPPQGCAGGGEVGEEELELEVQGGEEVGEVALEVEDEVGEVELKVEADTNTTCSY